MSTTEKLYWQIVNHNYELPGFGLDDVSPEAQQAAALTHAAKFDNLWWSDFKKASQHSQEVQQQQQQQQQDDKMMLDQPKADPKQRQKAQKTPSQNNNQTLPPNSWHGHKYHFGIDHTMFPRFANGLPDGQITIPADVEQRKFRGKQTKVSPWRLALSNAQVTRQNGTGKTYLSVPRRDDGQWCRATILPITQTSNQENNGENDGENDGGHKIQIQLPPEHAQKLEQYLCSKDWAHITVPVKVEHGYDKADIPGVLYYTSPSLDVPLPVLPQLQHTFDHTNPQVKLAMTRGSLTKKIVMENEFTLMAYIIVRVVGGLVSLTNQTDHDELGVGAESMVDDRDWSAQVHNAQQGCKDSDEYNDGEDQNKDSDEHQNINHQYQHQQSQQQPETSTNLAQQLSQQEDQPINNNIITHAQEHNSSKQLTKKRQRYATQRQAKKEREARQKEQAKQKQQRERQQALNQQKKQMLSKFGLASGSAGGLAESPVLTKTYPRFSEYGAGDAPLDRGALNVLLEFKATDFKLLKEGEIKIAKPTNGADKNEEGEFVAVPFDEKHWHKMAQHCQKYAVMLWELLWGLQLALHQDLNFPPLFYFSGGYTESGEWKEDVMNRPTFPQELEQFIRENTKIVLDKIQQWFSNRGVHIDVSTMDCNTIKLRPTDTMCLRAIIFANKPVAPAPTSATTTTTTTTTTAAPN